MENASIIEKVDKNKIYTVSEMRRLDLFSWLSQKTQSTYINAIFDDRLGENLLKVKVTGKGRGRSYKIKGSNIINYLKSKI